jgi:hypothetical protein
MCILLLGRYAPRPEFDTVVLLLVVPFTGPTILLLRALGWSPEDQGGSTPAWVIFSLSTIVNSILLAVIGGLIGHVAQAIKGRIA